MRLLFAPSLRAERRFNNYEVACGRAKTASGISLNSSPLVGPTIQPNLVSILTRFQFHKVGISADVAQMYQKVDSITQIVIFIDFWGEKNLKMTSSRIE